MLVGEHEHETPPVITPVVETESQLTAPLIDHAGKIAHIEEQQARHEENLLRQIADLEGRLQNATGSQFTALSERLAGLETKLEALATKPVEEVEEDAGDAVEFAAPEVENSPAPPENIRRGIRHRRKSKRKGGK